MSGVSFANYDESGSPVSIQIIVETSGKIPRCKQSAKL